MNRPLQDLFIDLGLTLGGIMGGSTSRRRIGMGNFQRSWPGAESESALWDLSRLHQGENSMERNFRNRDAQVAMTDENDNYFLL